MNQITQVILDGVSLPMSTGDRYSCWEEMHTVDLVMADRSMVREVPDKFKVWRARYSFDLLDNETYLAALKILRQGEAFQAAVLPDNGNEMIVSKFFCVSLTQATFAFADNGEAVWHNLAFELREEEPHA